MRLPHLQPFANDPLYFITASVFERRHLLAAPIPFAILQEVWRNSASYDGWFVGRYVVMPDHVHLFARAASDARTLAEWIKSWKSVSARRISAELRTAPPVWQRDYFDHFIRSADSYSEKWEYVRNNPVRKSLVSLPDDWPWQGVMHDLSF